MLAVVAGSEVAVWDIDRREWSKRENFPADPTVALAWHPDGRRYAVACWQRPEVWLCEVGIGRARPAFITGGGPLAQLMFSPGGDLLVGRGGDGVTTIWEVATERRVLTTEAGLAAAFLGRGDRMVYDRERRSIGVWEFVPSGVHRTWNEDLGASSAPVPYSDRRGGTCSGAERAACGGSISKLEQAMGWGRSGPRQCASIRGMARWSRRGRAA